RVGPRAASAFGRRRGVRPLSPGAGPAVSMSVPAKELTGASPSRLSRVKPGWASTRASRLPASRLNRVDLPTFGRPTMVTVKGMSLGEALIEGDQRSVVSQDIHLPAAHTRADKHRP